MRTTLAGILALVPLLAPLVAHAQEGGWSATFEPAATASHLPATAEAQVVVVAAGPPSPELRAAADAFTAGLRASRQVDAVIDDDGLGEVGDVDDATVLARVRPLPVSHVAIVRLVPGEPPKALVSIYPRKGGEALTSFIATAGTPLAAAVHEAAGEGVSSAALERADEVTESSKQDRAEAKARYQREFVGWDGVDVTVTAGNGWATARTRTRFFLGRERAPLDGADFYSAVGRDDLAASYESRENTRVGLMVGGAVLLAASLYPMASFEFGGCEFDDPNYDQCSADEDEHNNNMMIATGLLMGSGTLAFMIGYYLDADPVSDQERRHLAEQHNAGLRQELRLESASRPKARTYAWQVAPVVSPSYGGVALALQF